MLNVTRRGRAHSRAEGYDPAFGARPSSASSSAGSRTRWRLAVLEGVYKEGDTITVDALEGVLTFR